MIGADVRSEVHTPTGRIDMIVIRPDAIFLFEYKINETAEAALAYIEQKNYVSNLKHRQKTIIGIGISFSTKQKGIGDWKTAVLFSP
jgi:predicted type IV restriction endonuclease